MKKQKTSKEFYSGRNHPQARLTKANILFYHTIINTPKIKKVFEFGCNTGRHLAILKDFGYVVSGCDVSRKVVASAHKELNIKHGDENYLVKIKDNGFDVTLTKSVLCHMPKSEAQVAISEMKRIAKKAVIICECINKNSAHWYIHDYTLFGFVEVVTIDSYLYEKNNATYKIYEWKNH